MKIIYVIYAQFSGELFKETYVFSSKLKAEEFAVEIEKKCDEIFFGVMNINDTRDNRFNWTRWK